MRFVKFVALTSPLQYKKQFPCPCHEPACRSLLHFCPYVSATTDDILCMNSVRLAQLRAPIIAATERLWPAYSKV